MGLGKRICRGNSGRIRVKNMLKINQIKLPVFHGEKELTARIQKILKLSGPKDFSYEIVKKSLDARKKPDLYYIYSVNVKVKNEKALLKRIKNPSVSIAKETTYRYPKPGEKKLRKRPVIVGAGPAGLFAAYQLTETGYAPIIIERGKPVQERTSDVLDFWKTGVLNPDSNVQFGEGGAGTFSDGKLNTGVKDASGRNRFVLETFVRFGAPENILYDNKPHIGTDILAQVIENMRTYLENRGARFCFRTKMTELCIEDDTVTSIVTEQDTLETEVAILALGHSARDTFRMLNEKAVPMEAKNFAVGFRVEHPQKMIDEAMYGIQKAGNLPAAPYKVTSNFPNGRGVYSFCMCPGGYVVNASSENGGTCVNGMSYSGRSGKNANSAIIVSVSGEDFGRTDALCGMHYQEKLEKACYALGQGKIPQQLYGNFVQNTKSSEYGMFRSQTKGATVFSNLRGLLSGDMEQSLIQGMEHFSHIIPNFDRPDAILSGMETRTSSPVRILRDEHGESRIKGLFPCGEGAGYAGGIISAAIDGLKAASAVMEQYRPAE